MSIQTPKTPQVQAHQPWSATMEQVTQMGDPKGIIYDDRMTMLRSIEAGNEIFVNWSEDYKKDYEIEIPNLERKYGKLKPHIETYLSELKESRELIEEN